MSVTSSATPSVRSVTVWYSEPVSTVMMLSSVHSVADLAGEAVDGPERGDEQQHERDDVDDARARTAVR